MFPITRTARSPWTWLPSAGFAMSSKRSSVPTRTSGADRFGAVPPIVFWPVYTCDICHRDRVDDGVDITKALQ